MFKVAWARLCVYSDECMTECTIWVYARPSENFVLGARLGWARCTTWSDACAHGLAHGSVATHGLVAHGLNFMDIIEPCG